MGFHVPAIGGLASWVTHSPALPGPRMLVICGLQEPHLAAEVCRDPGRSLSWWEGLSPAEPRWQSDPGCGQGGQEKPGCVPEAKASDSPVQQALNPLDIQMQPGLPSPP